MSTANLSRMLGAGAARFGAADALVAGDRRWTYRELDADVHALAAGLAADGVTGGTRVAVVADNVPEFLLLSLALARLGAVCRP